MWHRYLRKKPRSFLYSMAIFALISLNFLKSDTFARWCSHANPNYQLSAGALERPHADDHIINNEDSFAVHLAPGNISHKSWSIEKLS